MTDRLSEVLHQEAARLPAASRQSWQVRRAAERHRHTRRVGGAVAAAVAMTLLVVVGLSGHRLLSAAPAPAAPRPTTAPVPTPVPGSLGRLAYVLDGDIYVAAADGRDPVRIADGAPGNVAQGCLNYWAEGPMWSPDGRYLVYRGPRSVDPSSTGCSPSSGIVFISDPNGRQLTSFPAEGWSVAWSPDSTRVAVWMKFGGTIGIFGLDGVRQTLLTRPGGCTVSGDYDPVWSPDGVSLLIKGCVIPVDGSALRQLPPDDPRSQWNARYSPDGTDVAFISQDGLAVADADGSHSRVLVPGALAGWYQGPVWSPTGDRIVFASRSDGGPTELRVVDVASGTVVSLADMRATADFPGFVIRFSPEGDQVLFARANRKSGYSLWSVHTDGSDPHRLVAGAGWGDWQKLIPAR